MAFGSDRGRFTKVKRSVVDKNLGPLVKTLPRWLIKLKPQEIVRVAGQLSDAESMMTLKDFLNKMGSNNVWYEANGSNRDANLRSGYILNSTIAGLEKADAFLLIESRRRESCCRLRKYVSLFLLAVQSSNPSQQIDDDDDEIEVVKSLPEPLCECASKFLIELASKAASSNLVFAELIKCFSKMGLSYLIPNAQVQIAGDSGKQNGASKSHVDPLSASKTNDLKSHGRVVDERPEKQLQIINDEKAR
ncbi:hypothetical protein ACFX2I_022705 [Malus domestica]